MRKAFTVVELLVVVAVVAALAAILLPVIARARRSAQQAACASNLRQIGSAITLYLEDWDQRFPWAWSNWAVGQGKAPSLPDALSRYVTCPEVWKCPGDTGETFYATKGYAGYRKRTPPFYRWLALSSYSWTTGPSNSTGLGVLSNQRLSRVSDSSRTPLSLEARPWHGAYRPEEDYFESPALYNVLYVDQHIGRRTQRQWENEYRTTSWTWPPVGG